MMAQQWHEVYRQVTQRLQQLVDSAPTALWRQVFSEALKRWQERQDFHNGKIGAEATVKIGVANEDVAQKVLQRIREFAVRFGTIEDDERRVVMLSQVYRKNGNIAVLLRLRIVAKTQKRSKFMATEDDV
jgi:hypothetical protein